jgi:hypothetical protein
MSDLFFFEADETELSGVPDVREVANYMRAMDYGLARLKELPISIRLDVHFVNSLPLLEVDRVLKPFIFKGSKLAQDL